MVSDMVPADGTQTRRALLAGAAGGLLAAVAGALGRPAPAAAAHLQGFGHANAAGTANTSLTTSSTGTALLVTQNGTGTALRGSATNGIAGFFTSANGSGVSGVVASATKFGIYGGNDALAFGDGAAIRASGQQNHGLVATSAGEDADALRAIHGGAGKGVFGESLTGTGVQGVSTTGTGVSASTGGSAALHADNLASTGGIGVRGSAYASSGTPYGVYGYAPNAAGGYAGYFEGNAHVTGTLSKGAGAFKIDHPLDPANRYLSHSFVESPDMLNVYNGNATTDADGNAVVELPAWFEALNRDFRYQLTVIGQPAQAFVATKVKENHFSIATDRPDVEVSWQVTGIRKDRYAEAHRIPVDERKPANERGTYLHPREHGQAVAKGLDAKRMKPKAP